MTSETILGQLESHYSHYQVQLFIYKSHSYFTSSPACLGALIAHIEIIYHPWALF